MDGDLAAKSNRQGRYFRNTAEVPDARKPSASRRTTKSQAPALTQKDMDAVCVLWDKVGQFPVDESDEALAYLARGLKKLLKADNVKWLAAVRVLRGAKAREDRLLGWRLRASYDLVPDPPAYQKMIAWWFRRSTEISADFRIGLATHAVVAGAGKFRTHRLRDGWIPFGKFSRSEHYRLHYTELGISDRMWVSFPLNADTESIFLIDRSRNSRHFTKREAALVSTVSRGLRSFHRRLFLHRGLQIGGAALSPVARRVVGKLLTGLSEKEIAALLNQSVGTTHKHITTIYKRFGVNGRAALMALWLGA